MDYRKLLTLASGTLQRRQIMKDKKILFVQHIQIILFALLLIESLTAQINSLALHYDEPAAVWTEALPIGNSFMGGMVFGDPYKAHIQLNESTLYSGDPHRKYQGFAISENYPEIMALIDEGKYQEGEQMIRDHWLGRPQDLYQPMSDLWISLDHEGEVTEYQRSLDIANALHLVSYTIGGTTYKREVFASYPDHLITMRLSAEGIDKLNGTISLSTLHEPTMELGGSGNTIYLNAQVPGFALRRTLDQVEENGEQHKYPEIYHRDGSRKDHAKQILYGDEVDGLGMHFQTRITADHHGGTLTYSEGKLRFENAGALVLYMAAATSFTHHDVSPVDKDLAAQRAISYLDDVRSLSYQDLRSRHIQDYRTLFDRVSLVINPANERSQKTTDLRIAEYKNGNDEDLAALFFQYGRYLMISGSRPGGQPLNLQGIWNHQLIPPWASAYTTNINLEMNYWPAEVTSLSECHEPLFRAVKEWSEDGTKIAHTMYGAEGWAFHHNSSIWRNAGPVDLCPCSFWPMGAGWLVSHLWEHYLFTGDKKFLREKVLPLLKGAVLFYKDWLVPNQEGYLVTPVGHSPEQGFKYSDGKSATQSPGPTMDMTLIKESFTRYLQALDILQIEDEALSQEIESKHKRLLPYQIGRHGQLQEWQFDFEDRDIHHRHISHLYAFHPGNQITPTTNHTLARSVKQVLIRRGDQATGWSMGWKVNMWARMYDGNKALEIMSKLINLVKENDPKYKGSGSYPNMFDAHPPFQIDGNFGATAGIAEMLVQSHDGFVHVLPALPNKWDSGKVMGLKTRGGFEVQIKWRDHQFEDAKITSHLGGILPIRSEVPLTFSGGMLLKSAHPNILLQPMDAGPVLDHKQSPLPEISIPEFYEYYIDTSIGEEIFLKAD